jgi:hypothetical protein
MVDFKLKTDPKLPYHYLISVGIKDMYSKDRGRMYLKYGPLKFTNADVENVQNAVMLSSDKLFNTSSKQATENFGVGELVATINSLLMAAAANNCMVYHFSSEFSIDDDYWEGFVDRANENEFEKEKLLNATIKSRGFI